MKKLFILIIKFYQKAISPIFGSNCRYYPTCSQYTLESIQNCGVFKGSYYGAKRILRCNPFFEGGEDYPPTCNHKHN
jgi:putative membrane protein insertion efficiency factor